MSERKKQSLLNGALVLVVATAFVEVVGVLYKIPLTDLIGTIGRGYTGTAYNIYIPIYNISMAGLPVAISKLVSQSIAEGHFKNVKRIFKVAFRLFFVTGLIGTVLLLILAYPYVVVMKAQNSLPSILMIAPAVFICCIMSTYRGYYSGLRNQNPSAVSQMFEVIGKLLFGLGLAYLVQRYGVYCFESGNPVFGVVCETYEQAVLALTPYAAAASVFGVTMGALTSLVFLMIRHKIVGDKITQDELNFSPEVTSSKEIAKMLAKIAVPVVISTLVVNITNLIDSVSLQNRLVDAIATDRGLIENMYSTALSLAGRLDDTQLKDYLYGAYEIALDFRNLVPTITTTLGLSAIPVLSEAWTLKNKLLIKNSIESVIRVAMLISMPLGFGMAILSEDILNLLYRSSSSVTISASVMTMYGFTIFIMAVSQPMINMLQAVGRPDIPMRSVSIAAVLKVLVNFLLVAIPAINIRGAVIGTVLFYLVTAGVNFVSLLKVTDTKVDVKSVFLKPLFCAVMCGLTAWAVSGLFKRFLPSFELSSQINTYTVSAVISIFAAGVVYIIALLMSRSIIKEDIKMLPKGEKICKILEKYDLIG